MKRKIFTFNYLRGKPARYTAIGLIVFFICLAPIYNWWYWNNVKFKITVKYTQRVSLYDIKANGDTLKDVLAIEDLKYKDSLINFFERRYNGGPDFMNFPFVFLTGNSVPFIEFTKDSLFGKIIFASYTKPKFYEEYYVLRKSIHSK